MLSDNNTGIQAADKLVLALDSKIFKALGEPVRAQILRFLILHGRSDISTIAQHLPQDRSVISRHLSLMAEAGLLHANKETRHVYYMINGQAVLQEFENIVDTIKKCVADCCPEK